SITSQAGWKNRRILFRAVGFRIICDRATSVKTKHCGLPWWGVREILPLFAELEGDSGYPLETILLTPFPNSATDPIELAYNIAHTKTRCVVERTIGHWKSRFRSLCRSGGYMSYDEKKSSHLITCSAVLHNICKSYRIPLLEEDEDFFDQGLARELLEQPILRSDATDTATQTRRRIAEQIYNGQ
ncbi:putative nuclease HARBI1, partial [Orchesella cincta]